jgi:hypothetical protein
MSIVRAQRSIARYTTLRYFEPIGHGTEGNGRLMGGVHAASSGLIDDPRSDGLTDSRVGSINSC